MFDAGHLVILLVNLPAILLVGGAGVGHLVIHLNGVEAGHILLITGGVDPILPITLGADHIHPTTIAGEDHTPDLLTAGPP